MPLPTLLQKGSIQTVTPSEQSLLDTLIPIDYIMSWFRDRLKKTGISNRILILKSDTGSGKTTALPPYLFNNFWKPGDGIIGITQPRVLTAISNAKEIASIGSYPSMKLGETIGWATGSNKLIPLKGVTFMTVGVLTLHLKLFTDEQLISKYKFIILDEVHDISVDMAIVLYLLKRFLFRNKDHPDLPFLICTSATLDVDKYLSYFQLNKSSNLIQVAGFAYPKIEHWLPLPSSNYINSAHDVALQIHNNNLNDNPLQSDLLIFLPGAAEMTSLSSLLHKSNFHLSVKHKPIFKVISIDREAITTNSRDYIETFLPPSNLSVFINKSSFIPIRKIILSTNVAETGLTLNTLKYVIDCGYNRATEFYPTISAKGLLTKPVSKSRVKQRMGRCGRKFPGEFYPIYTKEVFDALDTHQYSDLVLSDFSPVLLNILHIEQSSFSVPSIDLIDTISPDSIHHALEKLFVLGLYSSSLHSITPLGSFINKFNKFSIESLRMLMSGYFWKVNILDLITIATYLSIGSSSFQLGKTPINWIEIYKHSLPSFLSPINSSAQAQSLFKTKLIISDDFIDGLFLFHAIGNVIRDSSDSSLPSLNKNGNRSFPKLDDNFYSRLHSWCIANGLNINTINSFIKERDDLIEQMINLELHIFDTGPDILHLNDSDFINYIVKLKHCIYDGFRLNLAILDPISNTYKINAGSVITPSLFSHKELNISNSEKYGFSLKTLPKYILYDNLSLKFNKNTFVYDLKVDRISTMDGFVNIDLNFF